MNDKTQKAILEIDKLIEHCGDIELTFKTDVYMLRWKTIQIEICIPANVIKAIEAIKTLEALGAEDF